MKEPIYLIELFAGIGSQAKALKNIGLNIIHHKVIEFDKYAIASYNAVHGTNFKPTDITTIKGDDLEITNTQFYTYLMTYSFPCFTKDSLVLTDKGYKKIIDIKVGDLVLTHDGTYQKVTSFFDNGIHDIYSIKGQCVEEIKSTSNHKFYVRTKYYEWYNNKRTYVRKFNDPIWKELNQLTKNDYLGVAINKNSVIPILDNKLSQYMNNKDFWWLIGRYIGDGWIRKDGGIIICCAKNELNEITEITKKLMFKYYVNEERTTYRITIPLKELSCFVEQFGRGAKNKRLTDTILNLPIDLLKQFIIGYESADGCVINNIHKICSISRELIYGVGQCIAKVYKTPFRVYKTKRPKFTVIENRVVRQNDDYQIVYKKEKCKQDKAFYENGYIWFPIRSIKKLNKENVYDIEVEKNHSFTVQNTIVHNCQDLSLAGKGAGMAKGNSTRSGLLWEVERLLNECKELPQYLLLENVPQIHSKKHIDDFKLWQKFLESKGYNNYWQDLNAKNYGIPQNRNRTFMVSIRKDVDLGYDFPQPFELKLRLKDMLEDEVDEKYFLSNKLINQIINWKAYKKPFEKVLGKNSISPTITARGAGENHSGMILYCDNLNETSNLQNDVLKIKEKTKKGYSEAEDGDGVYINRPHQKRGCVQKGMIQTIKTSPNDVGVVVKGEINVIGNYSPSNHESSRIVHPDGIAPTVKENHGTVTATLVPPLRIRKLTPKECWRLMGFSDIDFEKAAKINSNAQLYKQAGNSIVVNVLEHIFKELFKERKEKKQRKERYEKMSIFDFIGE